MNERRNIHLVSAGGGQSTERAAATLLFIGKGDVNSSFISLTYAEGIEFRNLNIRSDNEEFYGTLVNVDGLPGPRDANLLLFDYCTFNGTPSTKALLRLDQTISSAVRNSRFDGGKIGILGRDGSYSNVITIDNCFFIRQTTQSIKNAGEAWTIQGSTFEFLADGNPAGYTQDLDYQAYGLRFVGNWFGDAYAPRGGPPPSGTAIVAQAGGLEISGNFFSFPNGYALTAIRLSRSEGVSITGNYAVGNRVTAIDLAGFVFGASIQGNSFNVGTPIANPGNAYGSTITANNLGGSPLLNSMNGSLSIKGEDAFFSLDALGLNRVGLVKKSGSIPFAAFGRNHSFSIAEASGDNVDPRNTFTPKLIVNSEGATVVGRFSATHSASEEAGRFAGSARSFITLGSGLTPGAGGYVLYDPTPRRLQLGVHASPAVTVDGAGNVAVSGNLSVTGAISKGSGAFLIDHPLDPENKSLYHGFVEAPRYDLIYRGKSQLIGGTATVSIDAASNMTVGTFAALTQNVQCFVQNETGWEPVKCSVSVGSITITCKDPLSADRVGWLVVAERDDAFIKTLGNVDAQGRLVPEEAKPDASPAKRGNLMTPQKTSRVTGQH